MLLRPATPLEKTQRDALTYAEWGKALTSAQYLEREVALRAHPFSNGMETWLWCDSRRVLSSCETYENLSHIGDRRGLSFSIASVFTEPMLRNKGHATAMLKALAQRLRGQSLVLFSDVGAPIYERSGFVAAPADDWLLPPLEGKPEEGVTPLASLPEVTAVPSEGLVLTPTPAQLDWALERERLYARFLKRTRPSFFGARDGDGLALWTAAYKASELVVLWLEGTQTREVLRSAQRQAHHCGLTQVRLWASGDPVPQGAQSSPRDGALPMYRGLGDTVVTRWADVQRALWV